MYIIQEAHCTENNMRDWRAEWGYQALLSCCTSKKTGVIIAELRVIKAPYARTYVRTYVRTTVLSLDISQSEKWHSRCGQPAFFGGKTKKKKKKQAEDNKRKNLRSFEIRLEMHANEIDALHDRH